MSVEPRDNPTGQESGSFPAGVPDSHHNFGDVSGAKATGSEARMAVCAPPFFGTGSRARDCEVSQLLEASLDLDDENRRNELRNTMFQDKALRNIPLNNTLEYYKRMVCSQPVGSQVTINVPMLPEQWSKFRSLATAHFPQFKLEQAFGGNVSAHPILRALRVLQREHVFKRMAHILTTSAPQPGYDFAWKEIGGRKELMLHEGHIYGHSCNPICDAVDAKRDAESSITISRSSYTDTARKFVRSQLTTHGGRASCSKRAQDCSFTAHILLGIHSSYDIGLYDICRAMIKANAFSYYGVSHWHKMLEVFDEGTLPGGEMIFKRVSVNGSTRLAFFYADDVQPAYHHDLRMYLDFYRHTSVVVDNQAFVIGHDYRESISTVFTSIYRYAGGGIPPSISLHMGKSSFVDKHVIVYSYNWAELPDGIFSRFWDEAFPAESPIGGSIAIMAEAMKLFMSSKSRWMHIRRTVYDSVLWNDVCQAISCLVDKNFDLPHAIRIAGAFNTKVFIDGQKRQKADRLPFTKVLSLAADAYYEVYRARRNIVCVNTELINDEKAFRALAESSIVSEWFSSKLPQYLLNVLCPSSSAHSALEDPYRPALSSMGTGLSLGPAISGSLKQVTSVARRYQSVTYELPSILTAWAEEVDACEGIRKDISVPTTLTMLDILPQEAISNLTSTIRTSIEGVSYGSFHHCDCGAALSLVPNHDDGTCLLRSLVQARLFSGTWDQLCDRLRGSTHLFRLANREELLQSLKGIPNADVLALVALEFAITVCLHTPAGTRRFGIGDTYHFQYDGTHLQYMAPSVTRVKPRYFADLSGDLQPGNRDADTLAEICSLHGQIQALQVNYRDLKEAIFPYHIPKPPGVLARSYAKTAEVFSLYGLVPEKVHGALSIGAPGSEASWLLAQGVTPVFGVTRTDLNYRPFDKSLVSDRRFIVLSGSARDGNLLNRDNIIVITEHIRSAFPHGISFFGGDAAPDNPGVEIDDDEAGQLVYNQAVLATGVLAGDCLGYIKAFRLDNPHTVNCVDLLRRSFKFVHVVKLHVTKDGSSEFHIVFGMRHNVTRELSDQALASIANDLDDLWIADTYRLLDASRYPTNVERFRRDPDLGVVQLLRTVRPLQSTVGCCFNFSFPSMYRMHEREASARRWYGVALAATSTMTDFLLVASSRIGLPFKKRSGDPFDLASYADSASFHTACDEAITTISIAAPTIAASADVVHPLAAQCSAKLTVRAPRKVSSIGRFFKGRNRMRIDTQPSGIAQSVEVTLADARISAVVGPHPIRTAPASALAPVGKQSVPAEEKHALRYNVRIDETPPESTDPFVHLTERIDYLDISHTTGMSALDKLWRECVSQPDFAERLAYELSKPSLLVSAHPQPPVYKFRHVSRAERYRKVYVFDNDRNTGRLIPWLDYIKTTDVLGLVNKYTEHGHDGILADTYRLLKSQPFPRNLLAGDSGIIEAGPGCGKTHSMITMLQTDSVVMCHSTAAANTVTARIAKLRSDLPPTFARDRIRASVGLVFLPKDIKVGTFFVDECIQFHSGDIVAAILHLQPRRVVFLGDEVQPEFHCEIGSFITRNCRIDNIFPTISYLTHSRRCDTSVTYRLNPLYKHKLPTGVVLTSTRYSSNSCLFTKIQNLTNVPRDTDVFLTYTDDDQRTLFHRGYAPVYTIRQYQGSEAKTIAVVRLNTVPQSTIFLDTSLAVVAISRHTVAMTYYSVLDTDRLVELIDWDGCPPSEADLMALHKPL